MKVVVLYMLLGVGSSATIKSYFLNRAGNLSRSPLSLESGRECLHTTRERIPIDKELTACYRQKPYMIRGYTSGIISFGKMTDGWTDFEYGFIFGVWYSGAWLGYKENGKPISWINMGSHFIDIHSWRHTCITLDMKTGRYSNFENGVKRFEETFDRLKEIGEKLDGSLNLVTVGCWHIDYSSRTEFSMYGEFTDFQLFGRILSDEEMIAITGCNKRQEGDIISWDKEAWHLNGTEKTSRQELLEFEDDVCRKESSSILLVPFKQKGLAYGITDTCKKLTGKLQIYDTKNDFDRIVKFLTLSKNMANKCYKNVKEKSGVRSVVSQLAITDSETDGLFVYYYTGNTIAYLPWAQDRPQKLATNYNCVRVTVEAKEDTGAKYGEKEKAEIWDGNCGVEECALCALPNPTAKMKVRGLCKVGSLFDKEYYYIIMENGKQAYLGRFSSLISYDEEQNLWLWTDAKDDNSKGNDA